MKELPPLRNLAEASCNGEKLYWAAETNNLAEVRRLLQLTGKEKVDPNMWTQPKAYATCRLGRPLRACVTVLMRSLRQLTVDS